MIHAQIRVAGQVQGVGFRPFVYRLAHELGLAGWVRNDGAGVEIYVEGAQLHVMNLIERLQSEQPVLSRVDRVSHDLLRKGSGSIGFNIIQSKTGRVQTGIPPDMAICAECLDELFDPKNLRYRHPFINCIHCGPRYTLTSRMPYDRCNTSMAKFEQCPACQAEYDAPVTRRFHAQPNCCSHCGPQLVLFDVNWQKVSSTDPVASIADRILAGEVVAIKGTGGFHLVSDARNAKTVMRLRDGKRREQKPFAVMVLNTLGAAQHARFIEDEATLLESAERPIVLLAKSATCDEALAGIAPGLSDIGLMLPSTPLHYLLFHELLGRPAGCDWLQQECSWVLVMTSANPGGEPLVKDDEEARRALFGLADAFLTHDRDILHRCDDSVMMWQKGAPGFVRRARGYTPRPIVLPYAGPSILACGAQLKSTVCITRGNEAFVSQHIGDLDCAGTRLMFDETVAYLCDILGVQPKAVAHDLHPDFYSTRYAADYAAKHGLPAVAVQHHHAHIAAICAEHRIEAPVLGLALDGMGLGLDGGAWGGELLRLEGGEFQRLGSLAPLAMPGQDRAAREPWRMAAAVLYAMGRGDEIERRFANQPGAATVHAMLRRGCASTSSMGRYFDAAAGLLGVCEIQGFEGQAAMLLEGLARQYGAVDPAMGGYVISSAGVLDFYPLLAALADCPDAGYGAALFHATLAHGLCAWVLEAATQQNTSHVALAGGCMLNRVLSHSLSEFLSDCDQLVLTARQLPPNDGAISFGQAAIALQRINSGV